MGIITTDRRAKLEDVAVLRFSRFGYSVPEYWRVGRGSRKGLSNACSATDSPLSGKLYLQCPSGKENTERCLFNRSGDA